MKASELAERPAPAAKPKSDPAAALKYSFWVGRQEQANQKPKTVEKPKNFETLSQDPRSLSRTHQLSADADLVYAEALVETDRQRVTLHVLFVNRTEGSLSDVELELFASAAVRVHRRAPKLCLERGAAAF